MINDSRPRRRGQARSTPAKLTVKMLFPIIVCFLPVFIIISVVPALISVFHAL
jgi:hypothetical protein